MGFQLSHLLRALFPLSEALSGAGGKKQVLQQQAIKGPVTPSSTGAGSRKGIPIAPAAVAPVASTQLFGLGKDAQQLTGLLFKASVLLITIPFGCK
jgi:hypothetical protein